jgi:hypothetical protein
MGAAPDAVFRETSSSHMRLELPIAYLGRVRVWSRTSIVNDSFYGLYVCLQQARFSCMKCIVGSMCVSL